jgi:predicted small secreted protein
MRPIRKTILALATLTLLLAGCGTEAGNGKGGGGDSVSPSSPTPSPTPTATGDASSAYKAVAAGRVQLSSQRPLCATGSGGVSCKAVQEWRVTVLVT